MKYNRTKDVRNVKRYAKVELEEWEGIVLIDLDKENFEVARYDDYTKPEWLMDGDNYGDIPFSRIIKTADTIEELCDVYIMDHGFGKYIVDFDELDSHAMGQTKEMLLSGQLKAYGAIWINGENNEPILKSVAKANKKGELKLL